MGETGTEDSMEAGLEDSMEAGPEDGMEAGPEDGMEAGPEDGMEAEDGFGLYRDEPVGATLPRGALGVAPILGRIRRASRAVEGHPPNEQFVPEGGRCARHGAR